MEYLLPLTKVSELSADVVGVRAADLAVLRKKLVNTPVSWVVTTKAFSHFIDHNRLHLRLKELLSGDESGTLWSVYQLIRDLFLKAEVPADLVDELEEACQLMGKGENLMEAKPLVDSKRRPFLLLIPSPTCSGDAEDNDGIFVHVCGLEELVAKLKESWASLFSPSARTARKHLRSSDGAKMAVILQSMIEADFSGNAHILSNNEATIKLRLGHLDYSGEDDNDVYRVNLNSLQIESIKEGKQTSQWHADEKTGAYSKKSIHESGIKPSKKEVVELSKLAKRVASYIGQDVKIFFIMRNQVQFVPQVNRAVSGLPAVEQQAPQKIVVSETMTKSKPSIPKSPLAVDENPLPVTTKIREPSIKEEPRETLLARLVHMKELIFEIEYLVFRNERDKAAEKVQALKRLGEELK